MPRPLPGYHIVTDPRQPVLRRVLVLVMYWLIGTLVVVAGLIALLSVLVPTADAEGVTETCSAARVSQGGATRSWAVYTGTNGAIVGSMYRCNGAGTTVLTDLGSGASLTLTCSETTSGVVPPAVADAITIRGYIDNNDFNNPGAAGIWVWNVGTSCAANPTNTLHCSHDGTAGGSARYGLVRLMIRAVDAAVPAYDVNSDDGGATSDGEWGIYRCNPQITAFTDGNPTSSPSLYVGSDTLRSSITADSAAYRAVTNTRFSIVCAAATNTVTPDVTVGTAAVTTDIRLKGSAATWPDDCTLTQRATEFRTSAITDLGAVNDFIWDQTSPPAGVTFPSSLIAQRAAKVLDRTLEGVGCAISVTPAVLNRGESATATCANVQNARDENLASGRLGRIFVRRTASFDTSDFSSQDFTYGASGSVSQLITVLTTTTDTNSTAGLQYTYDFRVWDASRTDAEFEGEGSFNAGVLDITSRLNLHTIHNSRFMDDGNVSTFTIAADQQFVTPLRLMGGRGQVQVGVNVDCFRTRPGGLVESAVDHGNTDAGGNAEQEEYVVQAPAGLWLLTCQANSAGNSLDYDIEFTFVSPLSSHIELRFFPRVWNVSGTKFMNITVGIVLWDSQTQLMEPIAPDDENVTLVITFFPETLVPAEDALPTDVISHVRMLPVAGTGDTFFWYNFSVPTGTYWSMNALVKANVSGLQIVDSSSVMEALDLTNVELTTAFDAWLPLVIFGGAALWFLIRGAAFPAAAALVATVGNGMIDPVVLGIKGGVLLILLGLAVHVLATRGRQLWSPRDRDLT